MTEGLITREEAVSRVTPEQVEVFLHPQFAADTTDRHTALTRGLNVSPGAAVGVVALDPDLAERWAGEGREVLLVRTETKPDDVHGMLAAVGILTSSGGRTSHAALVARHAVGLVPCAAVGLLRERSSAILAVWRRASGGGLTGCAGEPVRATSDGMDAADVVELVDTQDLKS